MVFPFDYSSPHKLDGIGAIPGARKRSRDDDSYGEHEQPAQNRARNEQYVPSSTGITPLDVGIDDGSNLQAISLIEEAGTGAPRRALRNTIGVIDSMSEPGFDMSATQVVLPTMPQAQAMWRDTESLDFASPIRQHQQYYQSGLGLSEDVSASIISQRPNARSITAKPNSPATMNASPIQQLHTQVYQGVPSGTTPVRQPSWGERNARLPTYNPYAPPYGSTLPGPALPPQYQTIQTNQSYGIPTGYSSSRAPTPSFNQYYNTFPPQLPFNVDNDEATSNPNPKEQQNPGRRSDTNMSYRNSSSSAVDHPGVNLSPQSRVYPMANTQEYSGYVPTPHSISPSINHDPIPRSTPEGYEGSDSQDPKLFPAYVNPWAEQGVNPAQRQHQDIEKGIREESKPLSYGVLEAELGVGALSSYPWLADGSLKAKKEQFQILPPSDREVKKQTQTEKRRQARERVKARETGRAQIVQVAKAAEESEEDRPDPQRGPINPYDIKILAEDYTHDLIEGTSDRYRCNHESWKCVSKDCTHKCCLHGMNWPRKYQTLRKQIVKKIDQQRKEAGLPERPKQDRSKKRAPLDSPSVAAPAVAPQAVSEPHLSPPRRLVQLQPKEATPQVQVPAPQSGRLIFPESLTDLKKKLSQELTRHPAGGPTRASTEGQEEEASGDDWEKELFGDLDDI
ncbi:hypothetical protein K505DRAFT_336623 [Melanomma pulvis-pyrius CBS 109.77]|uniref:Uncharacterized protein n=1 Tax=Melanomma pulvis-pyrius CBS 109.77 TaxID=1314802 RepID=A0A6A6XE22_9PLEO|nr:hypothetical protein K505DRAFT_336623 [Melanomma pulvis-pyrius CBS 109.77]